MLVEPERLLIILGFILFCGFCHQINGFLERQSKWLGASQEIQKALGVPGGRDALMTGIARPGNLSVTDHCVDLLFQC